MSDTVPDLQPATGYFGEDINDGWERNHSVLVAPRHQRGNFDLRQPIRDVETGHVIHCSEIDGLIPTCTMLHQFLHVFPTWRCSKCSEDKLTNAFWISLLSIDPGGNVRRKSCTVGSQRIYQHQCL